MNGVKWFITEPGRELAINCEFPPLPFPKQWEFDFPQPKSHLLCGLCKCWLCWFGHEKAKHYSDTLPYVKNFNWQAHQSLSPSSLRIIVSSPENSVDNVAVNGTFNQSLAMQVDQSDSSWKLLQLRKINWINVQSVVQCGVGAGSNPYILACSRPSCCCV